MADVAANAHSSNTTENNGAVVTGVDRFGNKHVLNAPIVGGIEPSVLDTRLDTRLDDVRYYSGDAAT
tara:strand:+ start:706 stop:906 length:201 start_codon:yes stop_codon:yes gene_type:complete